MTEKQRDRGRVITLLILLSIIFLGMCSGCTELLYKSDSVYVTHVLALTNKGDTVKIRLNQIKPQEMYHVVGYDFVRFDDNKYYVPYNDRRYDLRYQKRFSYYGDPYGYYGRIYNNNQKISTINNYSRGSGYTGKTTGGGNNPVASNPVTSGELKSKNN